MKKEKAVFLDRDGTINIERNYLYKISDFEYIDGVIEGLQMLVKAGYLLFIITNQSGIARGYYSEQEFLVLNEWMLADLREKGIPIAKVSYCPHLPEAINKSYQRECECRKPKLGMFYEIIINFNIDEKKSYAVGDKMRDVAIAGQSEITGILLCSDMGDEGGGIVKCGNLLEAARYIINGAAKDEG